MTHSEFCTLLALMFFILSSPAFINAELSLESNLPRKLSLNWNQMLQWHLMTAQQTGSSISLKNTGRELKDLEDIDNLTTKYSNLL